MKQAALTALEGDHGDTTLFALGTLRYIDDKERVRKACASKIAAYYVHLLHIRNDPATAAFAPTGLISVIEKEMESESLLKQYVRQEKAR